jgi:rfaE bifunctional protein nucleotidyltransferase chain/domain
LSHDAVRRPAAKILTRDELLTRHGRPRTDCLVFANGVFDILHRGHIEYLDAARRMGDCLVVALNTDESVRRLDKGHARPVVPQADRAAVLAALESVDVVTLFDEDTPAGLIARLLPDVLVKGGDYSPDQVVGRADVEAAGGRVAIIPFLAGRSTTDLIRRIRTDTDR